MEKMKRIVIWIALLIIGAYIIFLVVQNWKTNHLNDLSQISSSTSPVTAHSPELIEWEIEKCNEIPHPDEFGEVDVRHCDLSDLHIKPDYLKKITFDNATIWPDVLPTSFDPQSILENGKSPGLGISELHKRGITGKGVNICIIDQPLAFSHIEYNQKVKYYEEINTFVDDIIEMHGCALLSAAVGDNTGVAPGSNVYYIATRHYTSFYPFGEIENFSHYADCVDRVIEINNHLSPDKKIKVVAISNGFSESNIGGTKLREAIDRAKENGVFVITTTPELNYDFCLYGLGRDYNKNPDDLTSYKPAAWLEDTNIKYSEIPFSSPVIYVPMGCRTLAGPNSDEEYAFYYSGGTSWAVPWLAGMYALCLEVKPTLTPDEFIDKVISTSSTLNVDNSEVQYKIQGIINPEKLINAIQS